MVQYTVEIRNFAPNFQSPNARIGMLISMIQVPVGNGVMRLNIMEIPLTPPGARLLGSRNRLMPTA